MRLKRTGRKRQPSYRVVIMESKTRRDGRPVDQIGYYNSITKELYMNEKKIIKWLTCGVQPTHTVFRLLARRSKYRNTRLAFRGIYDDPDNKFMGDWVSKYSKYQNRIKGKTITPPRGSKYITTSESKNEKIRKKVIGIKDI